MYRLDKRMTQLRKDHYWKFWDHVARGYNEPSPSTHSNAYREAYGLFLVQHVIDVAVSELDNEVFEAFRGLR